MTGNSHFYLDFLDREMGLESKLETRGCCEIISLGVRGFTYTTTVIAYLRQLYEMSIFSPFYS